MPSVTLHLALAERTLERWRPAKTLFDRSDPAVMNAFRQGSFGPDFGYFPGGWRPLSQLSHCVRTGDLTRALLQGARTPVERAFAWGWVTHVLADHAIHPLIGCAVGELLHGRPDRFVDGDSDPVAHVRVEAGLDALWAARRPRLRSRPLGPVFDESSIGFVTEAYASTYGAPFDDATLLRSHRIAAVRVRQGLHLAAWTARTLDAGAHLRPGLRLGGTVRGLGPRIRHALGHSSTSLAFLLPVASPAWLTGAVRQAMRTLPDLFIDELASGWSGLGNWNLDTGRDEAVEQGHGGRVRALAALERARLPRAA